VCERERVCVSVCVCVCVCVGINTARLEERRAFEVVYMSMNEFVCEFRFIYPTHLLTHTRSFTHTQSKLVAEQKEEAKVCMCVCVYVNG
jgi:hypothetical protein